MAHEKWRQIEARVAAMSGRERLLIFAAAAVVILTLVQTLLLDKIEQRQALAQERLHTATQALAQIEQQKRLLNQLAGRDPDAAAKRTLAELVSRLTVLDADLATRGASLIQPERMPQVLKEMVRAQGGIEIVGIKSLASEAIPLPGAPEGAKPGFYRHGVQITLRGHYPELVAYLERLEGLPWRFNWSEAALDTTGRPDLTLTLMLHTLSLEEAWLRV